MGEGVERRQLLLILLLLLLSCVQRFLGGGLCPVLFCFLCNSPVECALPPPSLGQRLLFPYLFIFTKAVVVFKRVRVSGLGEKSFVWDWCFDLASAQGCAA